MKKASFPVDKRYALLDFFTNERGFQFFIGEIAVAAVEGEGLVTLPLPHHAESVTIKHPDYGQLAWKIPGKGLKKKKRYHAYLYTESLEKEYQQDKQWALLSVEPEHAIVYVDSLIYPIQNGSLALYLSLGKHICRIEAPFYQPLSDTIELTDSLRLERGYVLEPYYAYLTVETAMPKAQILLDARPMGTGRVETGRLMPGRYRLTVCQGDLYYYDQYIDIENAERKVVDLRGVTLSSFPKTESPLERGTWAEGSALPVGNGPIGGYAPQTATDVLSTFQGPLSSVHITAFNEDTEIWLNRERVGQGEWQGELPPGFYAVSSKKEGLDSRTHFFWVEGGKTVELNLNSPLADYGMLNVSCDELDATVFLNGLAVGPAPCVLRNLPVDRSYRVRLVKGGKTAEQVIYLRGNDIVNLHLDLKKK